MKFFSNSSVKALILIFMICLSNIQSLQTDSSVFKKLSVNFVHKNGYKASRNQKFSSNSGSRSETKSFNLDDFAPTEEIIKSIESGCWLVVGVNDEKTKYTSKTLCNESKDIKKIITGERVFKSRHDTYIISTVQDPNNKNKITLESFEKEENEDEKIKISDTKISIDELPINFLKSNSDFYLIELPENSVAIYSKHNYLGNRRIIGQEHMKEISKNLGFKLDINIKSIILSYNSSLKITLKSNIKSKSTYLFYSDSSHIDISSIISYSPESKLLNLIGSKIIINIKKSSDVDFLNPIVPSDKCVLTLDSVINSEELNEKYNTSLLCINDFSKHINMHTISDRSILHKKKTVVKSKELSINKGMKKTMSNEDLKIKEKEDEFDIEDEDEEQNENENLLSDSYTDEDLKDLKNIRLSTKSIIKENETVLLAFSDKNYKGKLTPIFSNVLDTQVEGLNDVYSYLIMESNCIIIFENSNYLGKKRMYCFNVNDLSFIWSDTKTFGSIILGPNTKVKLFTEANFKGKSTTITKSLSNITFYISNILSFQINDDDTNIEISKKNIPENCILVENLKKNLTDLICKDNFYTWDTVSFNKVYLPENVSSIIVKVKPDNILLPKGHYLIGKEGKVSSSSKIFILHNFEYVESGCAIFTKSKNFTGKIRKYCGAVNHFDLYGYSSILLGPSTELYAYKEYSFLGTEVKISENVSNTDQINLYKSISLQVPFSYSKYIKNYGNFILNFFMGTALGLKASNVNFVDEKKYKQFEQCANIISNKETSPINREVFDKNFITDLFDHFKLGETFIFKAIFKVKDFVVGQVYRGMHLYYKYYCGLKSFIINKIDTIVKFLLPVSVVKGGFSLDKILNPTRRKLRKSFMEWKNKAINKIENYKDSIMKKVTDTIFAPIKKLMNKIKDKFLNNSLVKKITDSNFFKGLITFIKCVGQRISTISTLVFKIMRLVSIIEKLIAITGSTEGGGAALIALFVIDFVLSQICDYRKYLVIKGYIETGFYYLVKHNVKGEKKVAFTYFGMALGMLVETFATNQSYTEAIWQVIDPFSKFGLK